MTSHLSLTDAPAWKGHKQNTSLLLVEAFAPVQEEMQQLSATITSFLPTSTVTAKAMIDHVFADGGKRIRPALYFLSCKMLGYHGDHLLPMAAVCEYIHTASLLHDDVVDDATMRRGKPSANHIWGDEVAVLVGDLIYSRASELMAATGNLEIVKTYAAAIRQMSEGEILQLENLYNQHISRDTYFRILGAKTGILIGSACKSAALLANLSTEKANALYEFGYQVGIAFQLIDDALDYQSDTQLIGKKQFTDLSEGKFTLPLILLWELADADEIKKLNAIVAGGTIAESEKDWIVTLVKKYETPQQTMALADSYTNKAIACLAQFPETPERNWLQGLAYILTQRNF